MNPDLAPGAIQKAPRGAKSRRARVALADRRGSVHVRMRSAGQCEVHILRAGILTGDDVAVRCYHHAVHVHHMISGRGKRGRDISALATHKQHVCDQCHRDIHGDVGGRRLERVGDTVPVWTDHYRRIR